jgi:hypothetical protein
MELYLVGQEKDGQWEFQGVFSSFEKAKSQCKNIYYFIAKVKLDEPVPEETLPFPSITYPMVGGEQK